MPEPYRPKSLFTQIDSEVIRASAKWTITTLRLLLYLNERCEGAYGQNVATFASVEMMVNALGMNERTIYRSLDQLKEAGEIDPHWRKGHKAMWYTLTRRTHRMIQSRQGDKSVTPNKAPLADVSAQAARGDRVEPDNSASHKIVSDSSARDERAGRGSSKELHLHWSSGPGSRGGKATEPRGMQRWRQQQLARKAELERYRAEDDSGLDVPMAEGSMRAMAKMAAQGISVRGDPCG